MTDAQAAKLRELAERARHADDAADRAEAEGARHDEIVAANSDAEDATQDFRNAANYDAILALLDSVEALRRERDSACERLRVTEINLGAALETSVGIVAERDAAMALLREARDSVRFDSYMDDTDLLARIDALLGGGEAK